MATDKRKAKTKDERRKSAIRNPQSKPRAIFGDPAVLPGKQAAAQGVVALGGIAAHLVSYGGHLVGVAVAEGNQKIAIGDAEQHPAGETHDQ